jgi:hypothetical protein
MPVNEVTLVEFTTKELIAIDLALSIAAGVYEADAQEHARKHVQTSRVSNQAIAAAFTRDAELARSLADRINKHLSKVSS